MKRVILTGLATVGIVALSAFTSVTGKVTSKKSHLTFFSHTDVEDISADNYKAVSTLDASTGAVVFSVPMQSFEFDKSLMQKHFNSPKFLDTKQFPKAKFKGNIIDLTKVHFDKDGTYQTTVEGEMTLHGETNFVKEKISVIVKGDEVNVKSKFNLTLADYKIAFENGKPSTNIAKTVEVSIDVFY